jgi:hypothetical protein
LIPGDRLLCADGQWVAVEEVLDTGEWEVVYNLRITDYHTYFVGDWDWGFSVWSHNTGGTCSGEIEYQRLDNKGRATGVVAILVKSMVRPENDHDDFGSSTWPVWWDVGAIAARRGTTRGI